MLELLVDVDGRPLSRYGCDGVVCATPTGSTAYAFSAGGPVVWPEVEALLLVPISAHALFSRPLVTAPTSTFVDHRRPVHHVRGAVLRRAARLRPAAGRAGHGAARRRCRCGSSGCAPRPFTDRLVAKFALPVEGWRGQPALTTAAGGPSVAPRRLLSGACAGRAADHRSRRHRGHDAAADRRDERHHRRDRCRQDDGGHRPRAAVRRPGRRRAGARRPRAGPWSRAGCGWPGRCRDAVHARVADAGAEPDDDGTAAAQPHGDGRGPVPGPRRRPQHAGRRCSARSASRSSPCTASPTSCGCCARPSSAPRSTGSPAPAHEKLLDALREAFAAVARGSPTTWPTGGATPASATRRPTCCGSASTRSPGSTRSRARTTSCKAEAQRLEHAEGLRTAAQVAYQALAGGGDGADETPDATEPARHRPAHAGGARPASTRSLGDLAARLDEAATLVGDVVGRAVGLPRQRSTPTRPGCRPSTSAGPRCAALTRKYADDVDGVIAWADRARTRLAELDTSDELLDELDRGAAAAGRRGGRAGRPGCPRPGGEAAGRFADAGHRRAGRAGHAARPGRGGGAAPRRPAAASRR